MKAECRFSGSGYDTAISIYGEWGNSTQQSTRVTMREVCHNVLAYGFRMRCDLSKVLFFTLDHFCTNGNN